MAEEEVEGGPGPSPASAPQAPIWVLGGEFLILLLSQAGRSELMNSVFTALLTFFICSFRLPKTVIKA